MPTVLAKGTHTQSAIPHFLVTLHTQIKELMEGPDEALDQTGLKQTVEAAVRNVVNAHHCESQSLHTHMWYMTYVHILQVASATVRKLMELKTSGKASRLRLARCWKTRLLSILVG
jgi:hypothetical protein